jgi:hypothetical protein
MKRSQWRPSVVWDVSKQTPNRVIERRDHGRELVRVPADEMRQRRLNDEHHLHLGARPRQYAQGIGGVLQALRDVVSFARHVADVNDHSIATDLSQR